MNGGSGTNVTGGEKKLHWFSRGVLIAVGLLWLLAISNRSLWLDEVHGAGWKAGKQR